MRCRSDGTRLRATQSAIATTIIAITFAATPSCMSDERRDEPRTFDTTDDAVHALIDTVKDGNTSDLLAIFGPGAQDLILSSDPVTARRNREVFVIAAAEGWRLADEGSSRKTLVIGHENWPFPIPLVSQAGRWRFDAAAGREEVLARRIGRNELAVIQICRTYVAAQRVYARYPHDGKPAGLYATVFRSDPGRQNGLYWPAHEGQLRSPLGDLVAYAADEGRPLGGGPHQPTPFYGYYFKILTAQGPFAAGGARNYIVGGAMTGGFALAAWPADHDVTGIMTFTISQEGILYQKDFGPGTDRAVRQLTLFDPDPTWATVE
jgi:Protein of unknown function (DUF2950)